MNTSVKMSRTFHGTYKDILSSSQPSLTSCNIPATRIFYWREKRTGQSCMT
jgi:hypothetical protein